MMDLGGTRRWLGETRLHEAWVRCACTQVISDINGMGSGACHGEGFQEDLEKRRKASRESIKGSGKVESAGRSTIVRHFGPIIIIINITASVGYLW